MYTCSPELTKHESVIVYVSNSGFNVYFGRFTVVVIVILDLYGRNVPSFVTIFEHQKQYQYYSI